MSVTVYIIIALLILGIIFTVSSIKMAEVDEGHLEELFDRKAFSKPSGWKEGKMPEALQPKKKLINDPQASNQTSLFRNEIKTKAKN